VDRVRCAKCGKEHDLQGVEPSYGLPDAYYDVPAPEREHRTSFGSDSGRIRDSGDTQRRNFLRAVLPVPIRGGGDVCWGVWIEVGAWAWSRARELWDAVDQANEPAFEGVLANQLRCYEATLGLPGVVQLTGPSTAPRFTFDEGLTHPLAQEQREGVYPERALEWAAAHVH